MFKYEMIGKNFKTFGKVFNMKGKNQQTICKKLRGAEAMLKAKKTSKKL